MLKLIGTTYKLLDLLPEGDPLKNKAKEKALAILEHATVISDTKDFASIKKEQSVVAMQDDIALLEQYLQLAKFQGWIGPMNSLILEKEYQQIRETIKVTRASSPPIEQKPAIDLSPMLEERPVRRPKVSERSVPKVSARQEKILEIMSGKETVQVADLIKKLPTVTKRTIRRDLDELLKMGRVARVGAWNQISYTLVVGNNRSRVQMS